MGKEGGREGGRGRWEGEGGRGRWEGKVKGEGERGRWEGKVGRGDGREDGRERKERKVGGEDGREVRREGGRGRYKKMREESRCGCINGSGDDELVKEEACSGHMYSICMKLGDIT